MRIRSTFRILVTAMFVLCSGGLGCADRGDNATSGTPDVAAAPDSATGAADADEKDERNQE